MHDSSVRGGSWLHTGWKEAVPRRHVAPHRRRTSSSRVSSATLHVTKWRVLVARWRESTSRSLKVVLTDTPRHRWLHVGIRRFLRFIDMARLLRFVNGSHQDSLHQQGRNRDWRITERYDGMCLWAMRKMNCLLGSSLLVASSVAIRLVRTLRRSILSRTMLRVCPWIPRALWQSRW